MAEHFTQWQWAGYLCQDLPAEQAEAMRLHLAAGCAACEHELQFWKMVGSKVQRDRDPLVGGFAEQALAVARPRVPAAGERRNRILAADRVRLVFDSFAAPCPSAVRSTAWARRHCVYELEALQDASEAASAEVMVERIGRNEGWSVVGQVLDATGRGWQECAIAMTSMATRGPAMVRTARTNGWGEFSLMQTENGPWRLDLQAGQQQWEIAPVLIP